ncbi:unnamed protein product [Closterium sp. Yama58-4]|nr:unnamed protein product [Closterium sp. Yama58-4]
MSFRVMLLYMRDMCKVKVASAQETVKQASTSPHPLGPSPFTTQRDFNPPSHRPPPCPPTKLQMTCASQGCFCSRSYETSINQSTPAGSLSTFAINVTFNPPSTRHQPAIKPSTRHQAINPPSNRHQTAQPLSISDAIRCKSRTLPLLKNLWNTQHPMRTCWSSHHHLPPKPLSTRHQTALRPAHLFSSRGYVVQVKNVASAQKAANQASTYRYPLELHHQPAINPSSARHQPFINPPSTRHQPAIKPPSLPLQLQRQSSGVKYVASAQESVKQASSSPHPLVLASPFSASIFSRVACDGRALDCFGTTDREVSFPSLPPLSLHRVFLRCSVSHLANPPCVFFDVSPFL